MRNDRTIINTYLNANVVKCFIFSTTKLREIITAAGDDTTYEENYDLAAKSSPTTLGHICYKLHIAHARDSNV